MCEDYQSAVLIQFGLVLMYYSTQYCLEGPLDFKAALSRFD
jgi:hypothetical protein